MIRSPSPRLRKRGAGGFPVVRVFCGLLLAAGPLRAQEPPDTLPPPDTAQVVPETEGARGDTVQAAPDSAAADSIMPIDTFPAFPGARDTGFPAAVWEWDREDLLSNRALTLTELLLQIPGVIALRGGDYGTPNTAFAFGAVAGRTRVFLDGFELTALEAASPDLSRMGLAALERIRVERDGTGLRIEIETHQPLDPVPTTLIEVGTGDLRTNLLRADFAHPNTLGGALTFSLDRIDTRGPGLEEQGARTGYGLRYGIHKGDRGGLVFSLRGYTADSELEEYFPSTSRSDWHVRGRWALTPDLIVDGFWGRSSYEVNPDDGEFGLAVDRSQAGLRLGWESGPLSASTASRLFGSGDGDGIPDYAVEGRVGLDLPRFLNLEARGERTGWSSESTTDYTVRASTGSLFGLRAFGSYSDGTRGLPYAGPLEQYRRDRVVRDSLQAVADTAQNPPVVPELPPPPRLRLTERTSWRVGGAFEWRGISASGAYMKVEADSLHPTGLQFDADGPVLAGGSRTGYEVQVGLPLGKGFRVDAAYQSWEEDWPYMPAATWDGEISYHGIFKPTGNLEVWGAVGVMGRDPMTLRLADPEPDVVPEDGSTPLLSVPFHQEWYGFLQIRVVTVSIFLRWENLAGKDDNLDFPGRALPRFRTIYGVRWVLEN